MRALVFFLLLFTTHSATISAQTHYDQQRQYREYKSLSEATQRAYSVPARPASSPSYSSPSSGSSSSYSSSSSSSSYNYGGTSNQAIEQLVNQWRRAAGNYTPEEGAEIERQRFNDADAARQYAAREKARIAEENAKQLRINRDAELEALYSRQRRSPEQARQYSFDSTYIPLRQMAEAHSVQRAEMEVYVARMNPFTDRDELSDYGKEYVRTAMQAHSAFLAGRKTADYETLKDLMDAFVALPVSTIHSAKTMSKRFPEHRPDIMRAELRAINFFYGEDFFAEYYRRAGGLRMEDTMEARWRYIHSKMPDDAVAAMQAVTEERYNPVARFAGSSVDYKRRLEYYTLLTRVPATDADAWLKTIIPDQHWADWKASLPEGFIVGLLEDNPTMVLAITKRSKVLLGK